MPKNLDNIFVLSDTLGIDLVLHNENLKGFGECLIDVEGEAHKITLKFSVNKTFKLPADNYGVSVHLKGLDVQLVLVTTGKEVVAIICSLDNNFKTYKGNTPFNILGLNGILHQSRRQYTKDVWESF